MSFLDRIAECNRHDLRRVRPFFVEGARVGWVRHALAERLAGFAEAFAVTADAVQLAPGLADFEARSAAVDRAVRALEGEGRIKGRRDEYYPVAPSSSAAPLLRLERAAVPHFGVRAHGVHLNGFVRKADGLHMWIGRRAADKATYPGQLDNLVAGGLPLGLGLVENLVKEAREEASMPEALARRAVPVGCITYCLEAEDGLKPDVQYCFDLELPEDFVPVNTDGEIAGFHLWPIARVAEIVRDTTEFKFNCNLVVIDFLLRHGLIPPDHPDYIAICQGLRR